MNSQRVLEGSGGGRRRVLVVEDDETVRVAVERGLELNGLTVGSVADAEHALTSVASRPPELLIVDVGLPGMSGIELCERLRGHEVDLPILVLSARDQVSDRIAGLQAGADDYLIKPFDLEELVLRVHALLRRSPTVAHTEEIIAVGPIWMDVDRRAGSYNGQSLDLSRREFDLLAAFASNPGIVLSRIRLLEMVWGYDFDTETNVVDVFVGYLRKKFKVVGAPQTIETVRGVGFVLKQP